MKKHYSKRVTHTQGLISGGEKLLQILTIWWFVLMLAVDGEVHPMGEVCTLAGIWSVYLLMHIAWIMWRDVTGR
jgi:hypothetical protein